MIDERINLNADSIRNNKNLINLLKLRNDYKIPLLILLTHSDNYCNEVKRANENWKEICKNQINKNKNDLLEYINKVIKEELNSDYIMEETDIIHTVLVEIEEKIDENKIIEEFDDETKEEYEQADDVGKKYIIKYFIKGRKSKENVVKNFLEKEINIVGPRLLIEKLKKKLPSQFHGALKILINKN